MPAAEKVFVAGHRSALGAALVRTLVQQGHPTSRIATPAATELDLSDQQAVRQFFEQEQPQQCYLAGARVGVLRAHGGYSADAIYDLLMVQANAIHAAFRSGVKKLLYLCPGFAPPRPSLHAQAQAPDLLSASLMTTPQEPYTAVRSAGIKLCESYNRHHGQHSHSQGVDFRSATTAQLYGPHNPLHMEHGRLVSALMRRFHDALLHGQPSVALRCNGSDRRELLHTDDLAEACVAIMHLPRAAYDLCTGPTHSHVHIGPGLDISMAELARAVASVVGYAGKVRFEPGHTAGPQRQLVDSSRLRALGWSPRVKLHDGLHAAYQDFLSHSAQHSASHSTAHSAH
jgi:GDP-L-fucose synthase